MVQSHVGIDAAKHHLDLAIWGAEDCGRLPHDQKGIGALCHRFTALVPDSNVVEATGGCEVPLAISLQAAVLVAARPELGQFGSCQLASLVGVAPLNRDCGQLRGQRRVWGWPRLRTLDPLHRHSDRPRATTPPYALSCLSLCQRGKPRRLRPHCAEPKVTDHSPRIGPQGPCHPRHQQCCL